MNMYQHRCLLPFCSSCWFSPAEVKVPPPHVSRWDINQTETSKYFFTQRHFRWFLSRWYTVFISSVYFFSPVWFNLFFHAIKMGLMIDGWVLLLIGRAGEWARTSYHSSGLKGCHQGSVATFKSGTVWLRFCAAGGRSDMSAIFILVSGPVSRVTVTVQQLRWKWAPQLLWMLREL